MTTPHASILDLNAIAHAIGKAKSSATLKWVLCVTKDQKVAQGIVIAIQSKGVEDSPQEWVELSFPSSRAAAHWLAIVCLWAMAGQRGGQTPELAAALKGTADVQPVKARIVRASCTVECPLEHMAANAEDYAARGFAGI